jgi:hypothetical protein
MSGHLKAGAIEQFCRAVEDRMCGSLDCEHLGTSCEGAGCDNRICKTHERYCSSCEQRYCEDCYEAHLEVCPGALVDAHDRRVEQELADEALLPEAGRAKTGGGQ